MSPDIAEVAGRLRMARRPLVFTGAGVSAESGIPTFRDQLTGLWAKFDPAQLATAAAFRKDPALVWSWYQWRRAVVAQAQPNPAHRAIAAMAGHLPDLTIITQNVDDLHERAGSSNVFHLHGSLEALRCFACARPFTQAPPGGCEPGSYEPPRCPHCNGRIRPGVVWFGEALPADVLQHAMATAKRADLVLVVGTSGVVYPAAEIPEIARRHGATVVHVNLEPVGEPGDYCLQGRASETLSQLVSQAFRPSDTPGL